MKISKWLYFILLPIVVVAFPFFVKWNVDKFFESASEYEGVEVVIGANNCGPLSLQVICMFHGIPSTVDELAVLARTDISGTTVANLCTAAKQKGFETAMVKWSIEDLKAATAPVIVFVDGNHFMVVESFEQGMFKIWDVPEPAASISERAFRQRWKGHVITFQPIFDESGPRIAFDRAMYDFGEIWEEEEVRHTFTVHNLGDTNLEISDVQSSCRCTSLVVTNRTLAPNEIGQIAVEYDSRGYRGTAEESITIASNDPIRPTTVLRIHGHVHSIPKALPEILSIRDDIEQTKQIFIQSSSNTPVKIVSVTSNVAGIAPTIMQIKHQATVKLEIAPNALNGISDAKVVIHTDSIQTPTIEVPVVVQKTEAIPFSTKRLLFGSVKSGESRSREVRLFVSEPSQFTPLQTEKQSSALSTELIHEDNSWVLRATVDDSAVRGTLKDTIKIQARYQGHPVEISIPVLAIIY